MAFVLEVDDGSRINFLARRGALLDDAEIVGPGRAAVRAPTVTALTAPYASQRRSRKHSTLACVAPAQTPVMQDTLSLAGREPDDIWDGDRPGGTLARTGAHSDNRAGANRDEEED